MIDNQVPRSGAPGADTQCYRVAGIVLAAGCSRRMGRHNKLLMEVKGQAVVRSSVQHAMTSNLHSTIVVLGYQAQRVGQALEGLQYQPAINANYRQGVSSSLRIGVQAARGFDAVAILLADMPAVTPKVLNTLLDVFARQETPGIVVAVHDGRRGHPVIWPAAYFPDLMILRGDIGGQSLLQKYRHEVIEVDVGTDGIFRDIDTRADLLAANVQSKRNTENGV